MKIPLFKKIRKESHRQIAEAQDFIMEEIFKLIPKAVFHGGTCIWRCYNGNRFSEDLDFYFPRNKNLIEELFKSLNNKGFEIKKKKISERSVYSELVYNRVSVRLEATFQNISGEIIDYEKTSGQIISIYGLNPEQLINEKINTYLKRHKIRDIYDVYFLLKLVRTSEFNKISKNIKKLINDKKIPEDTKNLKAIILEGIVPNFDEIKNYIKKKWQNPNI